MNHEISNTNWQIVTDMYRKPTDIMNSVPFNSAHPREILEKYSI